MRDREAALRHRELQLDEKEHSLNRREHKLALMERAVRDKMVLAEVRIFLNFLLKWFDLCSIAVHLLYKNALHAFQVLHPLVFLLGVS